VTLAAKGLEATRIVRHKDKLQLVNPMRSVRRLAGSRL
jgi:hypothetical protein